MLTFVGGFAVGMAVTFVVLLLLARASGDRVNDEPDYSADVPPNFEPVGNGYFRVRPVSDVPLYHGCIE